MNTSYKRIGARAHHNREELRRDVSAMAYLCREANRRLVALEMAMDSDDAETEFSNNDLFQLIAAAEGLADSLYHRIIKIVGEDDNTPYRTLLLDDATDAALCRAATHAGKPPPALAADIISTALAKIARGQQ